MQSSGSGAEFDVVSFPVENLGTSKNSEILEFCLSDGWAVVGDDHQLAGASSELLEGGLVT